MSEPKSFERKILPASDCAPKIFAHFPANIMIPIHQGGGGYPSTHPRKTKTQPEHSLPRAPLKVFSQPDIHSLNPLSPRSPHVSNFAQTCRCLPPLLFLYKTAELHR
jgi:hypothetical protein